jgi:hypothetical protein
MYNQPSLIGLIAATREENSHWVSRAEAMTHTQLRQNSVGLIRPPTAFPKMWSHI